MRKLPLTPPAVSHSVSLADCTPVLEELLRAGGTVTLTVTGASMCPFLAGGRDRVTLSAAMGRLKKNDLPLYRRPDGSFVLHRVVRVERDGSYRMCGDRQWQPELGIRQEQVIALASAYVRKGRALTNRNLFYRLYRTVWTWLLPWRPQLFRWSARLRRRA